MPWKKETKANQTVVVIVLVPFKELELFQNCICQFFSRNNRSLKFFSKHLIIYGFIYIFFSLQSILNAWNKLNLNPTVISKVNNSQKTHESNDLNTLVEP